MTVRDIEKYRRRNPAEFIAGIGNYRHCAVIPCFNENESFGDTLESITQAAAAANFNVAVLAVINFPPGADPAESLELIRRIKDKELFSKDLFYLYAPEISGGVGKARKLGMDSFLNSIPPEEVKHSFIYSIDGDTVVEKDYFIETGKFFADSDCGGAVLALRHQTGETPEVEAAIRRYEKYLDRYVEKLKLCGSPYAFHTVGSAFAVRGSTYLRSGGMKVRTAGEDFYFLQEVAKTSGIGVIEKILVHPSPRISSRTPFGTGQAVNDIIAGKSLPEISDAAFERLCRLLAAADIAALDTEIPELPEKEFLQKEKFFHVWPGIRRNTQAEKLCKAFHIWFDGLKTLRFLHYCDGK